MVDATRDQADLMSVAGAIDALWLAIRSGILSYGEGMYRP
jgi:hypothetical protein